MALFQRAGYVSDGLTKPGSALTIYRGELVSIREPGIAWTADLQIARQYAQGYATAGDAWWLDAHTRYFSRQCTAMGLTFSDDIGVIFERFELVWPTIST